jgi:uncharacterized protein (DUF58 family)
LSAPGSIRRAIDWGELAPLRLRAREATEGVFAGMHRSARRGSGVEFGGHREYLPGDDLRWLDRRSLLRHDRLVVRQFETETERALCLLVDASASMAFRGPRAPGAKLAFASVVAAALTRVALASGDPVSLAFLGGARELRPVARAGGREQFERVVAALEAADPGGDARKSGALLDRALQSVAHGTRRGAVLVLLSDLVDLPDGAPQKVAELASRGRILVVVQTLDPSESSFPYRGTVRLRALEGGVVVETDADTTRDRYLSALASLSAEWERALVGRGGRLVRATTSDDAVKVVRDVVDAVR